MREGSDPARNLYFPHRVPPRVNREGTGPHLPGYPVGYPVRAAVSPCEEPGEGTGAVLRVNRVMLTTPRRFIRVATG